MCRPCSGKASKRGRGVSQVEIRRREIEEGTGLFLASTLVVGPYGLEPVCLLVIATISELSVGVAPQPTMEPPASLVGVTSNSLYASLLILILLYLLTRPRDPLAWITSAPSLPILGSAPLLPRQGGWLTWALWSRPTTISSTFPHAPHGLLRLDLLTQRFILITSATLARTLLNGSKRRQTLSGRPPIAMIADSSPSRAAGVTLPFSR